MDVLLDGVWHEVNGAVEELVAAFRRRLADLDALYVAAKGPSHRRSIERRMRETKRELEELIAEGKVVDLAFERWVRTLDERIGT